MSASTVRILGGVVALLSLIPAGGPYVLGILRDDIHAHSRIGDLGLQAMTLSGVALFLVGVLIAIRGFRNPS